MTANSRNECYLDYNATTPIVPEVWSAMEPYFKDLYGNPSSIYRLGRESLKAVQHSRTQVAKFLHAKTQEIVFTGSGTESNNFAIHSALKANPKKKKIITSSVEHSSVRNVLKALQKEGIEIVSIPVDEEGLIEFKELEKSLTGDVALVSMMWANNETGVIFPVEQISKLVKSKGILLHVDAVQAAGKLEIDLSKMPIDLLSLSIHKLYGPKGVGVLFVRDGVLVSPLILGGHQEKDRRAGTENVPGIVGAGAAVTYVSGEMQKKKDSLFQLRNHLERELVAHISHSFINGVRSPRVVNTTNITIPGVAAEVLIPRLDEEGIFVSSGSACLTGALEPSFVLQAMGQSEDYAKSSIRLSIGYLTTEKDVASAVNIIPNVVENIRKAKEIVND